MADYEKSEQARRQSWHGAKKYVKKLMGMRIPHAGMRLVVDRFPSLRSGRLPAPASVKEVHGTARGVSFVMLRPDRCEVAKELYWGKGRRPKPADDQAVQLFADMARDADVVVDIGAYTGIFTLIGALANPSAEVHAFEPVPDVYQALFDNCVRNNVLDRVTLHHAGVGDPTQLAVFPAHSGGSALPSFYSARLAFSRGVRIRFRSLDWLGQWINHGARVLVKIDVEGTEAEVFRHGQEFLSTFQPDILCEVLKGVADPAELESLLSPHGYRYRLIQADGLAPESPIQPSASLRDWIFSARS